MPGPRMPGRNFLFVPGPTNVPDRVMRAMMVAMEDHRSSRFPELTMSLFQQLKKVFKTETGQPFIFSGSGTGAWEAALTNTLSLSANRVADWLCTKFDNPATPLGTVDLLVSHRQQEPRKVDGLCVRPPGKSISSTQFLFRRPIGPPWNADPLLSASAEQAVTTRRRLVLYAKQQKVLGKAAAPSHGLPGQAVEVFLRP
jgi:hypothetical protein